MYWRIDSIFYYYYHFLVGVISFNFFLYCLLLLFIYLHIFAWVGRVFFFQFISKLVMFLWYLNSCKIYLFKVAILYCIILFWWIKKYFKLKKKFFWCQYCVYLFANIAFCMMNFFKMSFIWSTQYIFSFIYGILSTIIAWPAPPGESS